MRHLLVCELLELGGKGESLREILAELFEGRICRNMWILRGVYVSSLCVEVEGTIERGISALVLFIGRTLV